MIEPEHLQITFKDVWEFLCEEKREKFKKEHYYAYV